MLKLTSNIILFCLLSGSVYAQYSTTYKLFYYSDCSIAATAEKQKFIQEAKPLDTVLITKILIRGYCDDVGTMGYSDTLSNKRAFQIEHFLSKQNITCDSAPVVKGMGEIPLDASSGKNIEEQRANNRRVEIEVHYQLTEKEKGVRVKSNKEKSIIASDAKIGDKITLDNILFVGGHNEFLPESYETLLELAQNLKTNPEFHILIYGHVCCQQGRKGTDGIDLETGQRNLSKVRAQAVYNYLVKNGIDRSRLSYKGLKGDYPLGLGDKFDRRVELEITKTGEK